MALYEIKQEYLNALDNISVDEDTGEVTGVENLEAIKGEFNDKAENISLYIKNLNALINDIHTEEINLAKRRRAATNKMNRLKSCLADSMEQIGVNNLETAKTKISFRKSASVEIDDEFISWAQETNADEFLKFTKPTANLTAIKDAIKSGIFFEHADIVEKRNVQIK